MADEKELEEPNSPEPEKAEEKAEKKSDDKTEEKSSGIGLLTWIIMAVVVAVCAGGGFGIGRLFGRGQVSESVESSDQDASAQTQDADADSSDPASEGVWYYDLQPVVANPDVPGATRYVRASLTLQMNSRLSQEEGTALIEEKKPILINWLNIYLKSLTLEDIRGDRNMKRIQLQILDAFNEHLFPDAKPQIGKILFKEFAVQ